MKKRINIVFFSICFLASLMAEAYCFLILDGEPISVIGIGIVVLIVCYLLIDTIQGEWNQSKQRMKFQLEQLYQKEAKKLDYKYTEILNLHKASYTAAKKNTLILTEKFDVLNVRLSSMEKSNELALKRISELQKKALEGQKNALNLEVNYNKENTKLLMKVLREECGKLDQNDQIALIISLLKQNQGLVRESNQEIKKDKEYNHTSEDFDFNTEDMDFEQELDTLENSNIENSIDGPMEMVLEDASEKIESVDTDFESLIPNNLEAELQSLIPITSVEELEIDEMDSFLSSIEYETKNEPIFGQDSSLLVEEVVPDELTEELGQLKVEDIMNEEFSQEIKPLYDDPNKALTADEIAALFATYGK